MIFGYLLASLAGAGLPSFVFLIGYILDSFNPNTSAEEQMDTVSLMSMLFVLIGAALWLFSFGYYTLFIIFSERVGKKIRLRYLRAILQQECAWYDLTNPNELSARIGKECIAIQKALGEKVS
jgi:ATP-binding cassette subfamily B (MDR/TAP) protein 1